MKKFTRNVVVAFLTKILTIVSAIIAQNFILRSFGSEINGLTSSITQFITYFTLFEAGLGVASIQALYAPLHNKNNDVVDSILSATDKQYKKIGFIFLGLTIFLAFMMPIITNSSLDYFLVFTITILMGLSNVINYFFIGKFNALLSADRNIHIINILDSVLGIVFSFLKVIVINLGGSIILVLALQILSPLIRAIFLYVYVKIKYPHINFKAEPKNEYISKRWSVLVHQVVGMVTNHTAVIILSISSTLANVSVYTVYNFIYSNINNVLQTTLLTAPQASFGKLYQSDDKDKFLKTYNLFECMVTCFIFIVLSLAIVLTIPFVKLYTIGVNDVEYIDFILGVLFAISILFSTIRIPMIMMVNIAGKFKETQKGAIIEAIISVVVSIPMYIIFGMRGLVFGTCAAMIYRAIDILIYTYKNIINKKISSFIKMFIIFSLFSIVYVFIFVKILNIDTWFEWIGFGSIAFLIGCIWFFVPILIFYTSYVKIIFKFIKNKFGHKNKIDNNFRENGE